MPFWSDAAVEPKRSYRFLFELVGASAEEKIASYFVKSAQKPKFEMESSLEIKYIQHTFYYPGRIKWNPVDITVLDPGTPDATAILMNIIAASGYVLPTREEVAQSSISKVGAINAGVGDPKLTQIDAEGKPVEEWTLHNSFLTAVDFGEVSYDNDEILNYTLTLAYDYASLSTKSTAVNAKVASKSPVFGG